MCRLASTDGRTFQTAEDHVCWVNSATDHSEKPVDMTKPETSGRSNVPDTGDPHSGVSVHGLHYETGQPVRIDISGGLIRKITPAPPAGSGPAFYIAPGLFDNQVNGYAGVDFSGDDLTVEGIRKVATALWEKGVTSFFPTLITNSHENLVRNFRILSAALEDETLKQAIPGFHLEGPYISPEDGYRGTHPAAYVRKPSWKEFSEYLEASGGRILQLTMAPELEGARGFIRECVEAGTEVAIGHSSASAQEIAMAVELGVRLSVHLGNGCANMIHRHHNPIWPQLADDRIIPSLIADGHHLTDEEIRVFYKVKGPGRMILTSDVTALAGMPPGMYHFAGSDIRVTEEGVLLNVEQDCLAGASLPLIGGVGHFMEVTGCSLAEAMNMAGRDVAAIYGFSGRSVLKEGARADLVLFERTGPTLEVRETWVSGVRRYVGT